jgi:single-strand DNA-binding protein
MSKLKMPQINDVRLSGRVTRDATVRTINAGMSVTEFSLAVDKGFGDKKQTMFVQIEAWNNEWNKLADRAAAECKKGVAVIVDGELWRSEYTDREGKRQSKTRVTARRIHTLEWPDEPTQDAAPDMGEMTGEDRIPF